MKKSEETRKKMSEAHKGKIHSEEWNKNVSKALTGRHLSEETKEKLRISSSGRTHTEETKMKISNSLIGEIGENNRNWKGGRRKNTQGYIEICCPNHPNAIKGEMKEHRLVVEKFIGRYLTSEEIIHHINFIKDDNRIENLMLFKNKKEHASFHRKLQQFGETQPIRFQIEHRWDAYCLV